jgi:hypothetical protein
MGRFKKEKVSAAGRLPKQNSIIRINPINYDELFLESERPSVVVSGLTCSVCCGDEDECDNCNGTGIEPMGSN